MFPPCAAFPIAYLPLRQACQACPKHACSFVQQLCMRTGLYASCGSASPAVDCMKRPQVEPPYTEAFRDYNLPPVPLQDSFGRCATVGALVPRDRRAAASELAGRAPRMCCRRAAAAAQGASDHCARHTPGATRYEQAAYRARHGTVGLPARPPRGLQLRRSAQRAVVLPPNGPRAPAGALFGAARPANCRRHPRALATAPARCA